MLSTLDDAWQLGQHGQVLARTARIEATYGGEFAGALTQVALDFDATIHEIIDWRVCRQRNSTTVPIIRTSIDQFGARQPLRCFSSLICGPSCPCIASKAYTSPCSKQGLSRSFSKCTHRQSDWGCVKRATCNSTEFGICCAPMTIMSSSIRFSEAFPLMGLVI